MGLQISFNTKPAVSFMSISFDREIVDEINEYIDESVIPQNIDASGNLVGQIKKSEKSSQLIFPHDDGDVGEQFGNYILLTNKKISHIQELVPILEKVHQKQKSILKNTLHGLQL